MLDRQRLRDEEHEAELLAESERLGQTLLNTEYNLLRLLVRHAGKVLTHGQILREVWGPGHEADNLYLRVYVARLREKLQVDASRPELILNRAGRRLSPECSIVGQASSLSCPNSGLVSR